MCGKYGVNMNDEKEKYTADDYRETSFLVIDDEDSSKVIHDFVMLYSPNSCQVKMIRMKMLKSNMMRKSSFFLEKNFWHIL